MLFSWWLQNGPHDFDFFQLQWVPIMYAFYVKNIETHARAFFALNILAIGRVTEVICFYIIIQIQNPDFVSDKRHRKIDDYRIYMKTFFSEAFLEAIPQVLALLCISFLSGFTSHTTG